MMVFGHFVEGLIFITDPVIVFKVFLEVLLQLVVIVD